MHLVTTGERNVLAGTEKYCAGYISSVVKAGASLDVNTAQHCTSIKVDPSDLVEVHDEIVKIHPLRHDM